MKVGNNSFLPVIALTISTIGVASALVFVKLSEVDATSTLMLRMFLAGGIASAITTWSPEKGKKTENFSGKHSRKMMFGLLLLSGAVSTVDLLSNHWAVKMTSVVNTSILMNMTPIFVALLSFLFMKERMSVYKLLALALCVVGACLLVFDDNSTVSISTMSVAGDLLALNSALFYAIYLILTKSLRDYFSSSKIIIWNSLTCALLLLPLALATSSQLLPHSVMGWLAIILLALISQLLGHGLMAYALKHVNVVLASISTLARPIVSVLFGLFIFNEKLQLFQWIGIITVLVGIWWYNRSTPRGNFPKSDVLKSDVLKSDVLKSE